jgi:DNA-binding CsgD family transcriptional regulator
MIYSEESERIFQKVKKFFQESYPQEGEINYQKYIDQLKIVEVIVKHHGGVVVLFDRQKLKIVHIIGNSSGSQMDDLKRIQFFFQSLSKDHKTFPIVAAKWNAEVLSKLTKEERKGLYINYCGINVIRPENGQNLRWNISTMNLDDENTGNSPLVLLIINNIAHLVKGKGYWFRASTDNGRVFSYFSEDEQSQEEDIISVREKEILRYVFEGMNTKKIAELLQISPNTVDNHRRNMLARTGAKDTTALIQLCQINGVL